jgi:hypothetical protein
MPHDPIYVEILIRAPLDAIWSATQEPEKHVRWDLRFTDIDYLPRDAPEDAQQFRYATRLGLGIAVEGRGETRGERALPDGSRASSLRFWSNSPIALIREGSGYWRYVPTEGGVRFLTWYDYRVRYGGAGQLIDRLLFRPLMGWATAWSFDRLRLWLETGVEPEHSLRQWLVHHSSRSALAMCWTYQGLVPKLMVRDSGELELLRRSRLVAKGQENAALILVGIGEVMLGLAHVVKRGRRPWPLYVSLAALPALAIGALRSQPEIFVRPFNPMSLTVAMMGLAGAALLSAADLPSASACRRAPHPASP